MDIETLGFWELIKLDIALDIEFISRYWMWVVPIIIIYIVFNLIID